MKQPTRRRVLTAGATVTTFSIVPSSVLAQAAKKKKRPTFPDVEPLPPSERLNIGFIGAGGRARANIKGCMQHNVHALCDVDSVRAAEAFKHFSSAKHYDDWRVMLDKDAKHLDAVVVTTPDHSHAVATMAAMKLGLPVYTEKPLTRTISEARTLAQYAAENKIVTQMGNQGHAAEGARLANEWIQGGLLGDVTEVHCWTDRPAKWWPQGVVRPAAEPIPSTMNWEVWLGPAPAASYSSKIAPFNWRGFWDYGAGALGDMGAHIIDHPVWALELGAPLSVDVQFDRQNPASAADTYPVSTKVVYQFGARGAQPPVTLIWYDGHNKPPRPEQLEAERSIPDNGILYYGTENILMQESHGGTPRIIPESAMQAVARAGAFPPKSMKRSPGHYEEWIQAIKANDPAMARSNFGYAGPLTETMLLGCVATHVGPGTKLTWDPATMKTDNDLANRYVQHEYRKGWSL
ncbi:Gfo/Idh/MocA family oxidoreductase [Pontiellaceae bacterium B12219]|nr:Gfo/Idh/MocA family oxidoreductase [Pontiellaceae bacterium B12219]